MVYSWYWQWNFVVTTILFLLYSLHYREAAHLASGYIFRAYNKNETLEDLTVYMLHNSSLLSTISTLHHVVKCERCIILLKQLLQQQHQHQLQLLHQPQYRPDQLLLLQCLQLAPLQQHLQHLLLLQHQHQ